MKEIAIVLWLIFNAFLLIAGTFNDDLESVVIGAFGIIGIYLLRLQDAVEAKRLINVSINTRPKWIALSERKPTEDANVVVMGYDGSVAIVRRVGDGWAVVDDVTKAINEGIKFAILLPHLDWVPTHWMPLPEMPEVAE